jgi:hypothetical protein
MRRRSLGLVAPLVLIVASCGRIGEHREPWCRPVPATTLIAQAVPSASLVPCVRELPQGWTFAGFTASDEGASFTLAGPEGSNARAEVRFVGRCDGAAGTSVRSDERGTDLLEEVRRRTPYAGRWTYRFEGGCASIDLSLAAGGTTDDLATALSLVPRTAVV